MTVNDSFELRDRNVEIRISSPLKLSPDIEIIVRREKVCLKDNVPVHIEEHSGIYMIRKKLSEIAAETVTLPEEAGGVTLTAAQLALAVELLTDKFAQA